jgi:uncharacterized protein (DUF2147 family)
MMKKLFVVAAFVLASTAAQAQYTFEYGGRTIRIDPDKGTVSIPGVYDNTGKRTKRSRSDQDADRQRKPDEASVDPQTPAAAPAQPEAPAAVNPPAAPAPATANAGSSDTVTSVQPSGDAPATTPPAVQDTAPAAKPEAPPPVVATAPVPPASQMANSPIGVWLTEEKEGKVRIEQCGANLCGYSVDAKSNKNGDQVLINMKPGKDKWSGRIFDPKSGSTYDSTIALKSSDSLRVQGCALGGMFCGGQTWSRVN